MSNCYEGDVTDLHRDLDSETSSVTNRHERDYYYSKNSNPSTSSRVSNSQAESTSSESETKSRKKNNSSDLERLLDFLELEEDSSVQNDNSSASQKIRRESSKKEEIIPQIAFVPHSRTNSTLHASPPPAAIQHSSGPVLPIASVSQEQESSKFYMQPPISSVKSRSINSTPSPSLRAASTFSSRTVRSEMNGIDGVRIDRSMSNGWNGEESPSRSSSGRGKGKGRIEREEPPNEREAGNGDFSQANEVADMAQQEFEQIIYSQNHSPAKKLNPVPNHSHRNIGRNSGEIISVQPGNLLNSPTRPISRLRNIITPPVEVREEEERREEYYDEVGEREWISGREGRGREEFGEDDEHAQTLQWNGLNPNPMHQAHSQQSQSHPSAPFSMKSFAETSSTIFDQLRASNEEGRILHLQVLELKLELAQRKQELFNHRQLLSVPQEHYTEIMTVEGEILEPTGEEVWNLVKHVIAVQPDLHLPPHTVPIKSISSALDFARRMDQLVNKTKRRDEDIFLAGNVERLTARMESWERMARSS